MTGVDATRAGGTAPVVVVGAGPAGLVLSCLLLDAGIEAVVLEHRTREHCCTRPRAGFFAPNTVRVLRENGLAEGLLHDGRPHGTCEFRGDGLRFELQYDALGRCEPHTVYPQQDLVRDLIADVERRGGEIRFGCTVTGLHDLTGDRPSVTCVEQDGATTRWEGRYIAGCDGQHGACRRALPAREVSRSERDHGLSWLAVLAEAPQSASAVVYATHERGFAGHMARSPTVTRYYLQCARGEDPGAWSDDRIWTELHRRMRADEHGPLHDGPITERGVVDMRSTVLDPIQHGRLFLAGDAASLISPSAAKGANLAVMEAETLAHALTSAPVRGDERALERYSDDCVPRIWRAQEFSHWMLGLLHGPAEDAPDREFLRGLQQARLRSLMRSPTHQHHFATDYLGI